MKRGEIYIVDIPYSTGHEIQKTRPAVIVGDPEVTSGSGCVLVAFCSSSAVPTLPYRAYTNVTEQPSTVLLEQLYTVDVSRLLKYVGEVTANEMREIDLALKYVLGKTLYADDDTCRPTNKATTSPPPPPVPVVSSRNGRLAVSVGDTVLLEVAV